MPRRREQLLQASLPGDSEIEQVPDFKRRLRARLHRPLKPQATARGEQARERALTLGAGVRRGLHSYALSQMDSAGGGARTSARPQGPAGDAGHAAGTTGDGAATSPASLPRERARRGSETGRVWGGRGVGRAEKKLGCVERSSAEGQGRRPGGGARCGDAPGWAGRGARGRPRAEGLVGSGGARPRRAAVWTVCV